MTSLADTLHQGTAASAGVSPAALVPAPWLEQVREARERRVQLRVRGGGTKDGLGDASRGEVLDTREWSGIVAYEPSELVITARAGTPLSQIEAALAERGQYLAFEPPRWGRVPCASTIGGVVAAGLSGPSRASRGAVRDHTLGVRMINGRAQALRFGGSVMKNVAGFDLSRLMAGSMGTLGVLTEVTLKVMPRPVATATLRFEMSQAQSIQAVNEWAGQPLPLDASAWWDGLLVLRLSGAQAAVQTATTKLAQQAHGELIDAALAETFWAGVRDQQDEFFATARSQLDQGARLWRLSVPATTPPLSLPGQTLVEWFGAQRWLSSTATPAKVHEAAAQAGGHAMAWLSAAPQSIVLPEVLLRLHRQVQQAFDPDGVFDTGRLWPAAAR
jgi:glycolate oxidase FAD binding subunit